MEQDLSDTSYRKTKSECHVDGCSGRLWYDDNIMVCAACSASVDLDQRRRQTTLDGPWRVNTTEPARYRYSNNVKLPGGFIAAYDWVSSDDVDGGVSAVSAENFYR